jgi:phosphoheptose isomerase
MGGGKAYESWKPSDVENFIKSVYKHAAKHDFTVIDLTGASEEQIIQIMEAVYKLPKIQQGGIYFVW